MVVCGAVSQLLPGERRDINGELMQSGERGNPDHSPTASKSVRAGNL